MRLYARIALLLGGFLLAGGLVYGGTSKERIGLVLLLVAGAGFTYVGLYARRAVRADADIEGAHVEEVRPTIWPLVFSLAGAGIIAGVLASHWILLAGGLLAAAAGAGWFLEVLIQRREHH